MSPNLAPSRLDARLRCAALRIVPSRSARSRRCVTATTGRRLGHRRRLVHQTLIKLGARDDQRGTRVLETARERRARRARRHRRVRRAKAPCRLDPDDRVRVVWQVERDALKALGSPRSVSRACAASVELIRSWRLLVRPGGVPFCNLRDERRLLTVASEDVPIDLVERRIRRSADEPAHIRSAPTHRPLRSTAATRRRSASLASRRWRSSRSRWRRHCPLTPMQSPPHCASAACVRPIGAHSSAGFAWLSVWTRVYERDATASEVAMASWLARKVNAVVFRLKTLSEALLSGVHRALCIHELRAPVKQLLGCTGAPRIDPI